VSLSQYFPVCRILHALVQQFGRHIFILKRFSSSSAPLSHPHVPINCSPYFISFSIFYSFVLFYLLFSLFPTSSTTRHSFLSCFPRISFSCFSHLTFSFITVFPSLFIAHSFNFLPSLLPSRNFVSFHRPSFSLFDHSTSLIFPAATIFHTPTAPNTYCLF